MGSTEKEQAGDRRRCMDSIAHKRNHACLPPLCLRPLLPHGASRAGSPQASPRACYLFPEMNLAEPIGVVAQLQGALWSSLCLVLLFPHCKMGTVLSIL